MSNHTAALDISAKLWSLCHVLRDGGITYHQYLSELTYLLFLKMMKETGQEDRLTVWKLEDPKKKSGPKVEQPGTRWDDLLAASARARRVEGLVAVPEQQQSMHEQGQRQGHQQ